MYFDVKQNRISALPVQMGSDRAKGFRKVYSRNANYNGAVRQRNVFMIKYMLLKNEFKIGQELRKH